MAKKEPTIEETSQDNMSEVVEDAPIADPAPSFLFQPIVPPVEPVAPSDHYEGKQHYPKVLYHADHAARKISSPEEHAALEQEVAGWTEAPAEVTTPSIWPPDLPGVKA